MPSRPKTAIGRFLNFDTLCDTLLKNSGCVHDERWTTERESQRAFIENNNIHWKKPMQIRPDSVSLIICAGLLHTWGEANDRYLRVTFYAEESLYNRWGLLIIFCSFSASDVCFQYTLWWSRQSYCISECIVFSGIHLSIMGRRNTTHGHILQSQRVKPTSSF